MDYKAMKVAELREKASGMGIQNVEKMKKQELVELLENIEKMKKAASGFHVDMSMVPKPNMDRFIRAMAEEMLRVKVEEPETWAKICARAEEIRREKAHKA